MTLLEFRKRIRYALYLAAQGEQAAADDVNGELRAYVDSAIDTVIHTHRKRPSHSFAYHFYCEGMEQKAALQVSGASRWTAKRVRREMDDVKLKAKRKRGRARAAASASVARDRLPEE